MYTLYAIPWCCVLVFFFFSSRRRHTRFDCDWSSDVCSSDLAHRGSGGRGVRHPDLYDRRGDAGPGPGPDGAGARGAALPDDAGRDRRAVADRDRLHERRPLLPRHRHGIAAPHLRGDQSAGEVERGAGGVPPLRRSVPRAARARARRPGARDRPVRDVRGAGALMSFDAPVVLALAPLIGGAVWFAAAWARRARVTRAGLWAGGTVRRGPPAGGARPPPPSSAAL